MACVSPASGDVLEKLSEDILNLLIIDKSNEMLQCSVHTLAEWSNKKIIHRCVVCGQEKINSFKKFVHKIGLSHKECSREKRKLTCLQRYGVEESLQAESVKRKRKSTCLEKYGCSNPFQSDSVRDKIRSTVLQRYGVENVSSLRSVKQKRIETNLKNRKVENPLQCDIVKDRVKQTNLTRYGTEWSLQNEEVRDKIKRTNLEKYGVECVLQCREIRKKIEQTNLKRYGTIFPAQNENVRNKIMSTHLERDSIDMWKVDEINVLKIHYPDADLLHILQLLPNRTLSTIRTRASVLNIYREKRENSSRIAENLMKYYLNMIYLDCEYRDNYRPEWLLNSRTGRRLELDRYYPCLKLAFEYNGKQHYEFIDYVHESRDRFIEQLKRDVIKRNLCKRRGIRLVTIPYNVALTLDSLQQMIKCQVGSL